MTHNQIDFWNFRENQRHNLATEGETGRHNVVTEVETNRHNVVTEGETARHNVQTEQIDISKLNETARHNKATERQAISELAETTRSHKANEGIAISNLAEVKRHNVQSEKLSADTIAETARHNKETEEISAVANDIASARQKIDALKNLKDIDYINAQMDNLEQQLEVARQNADTNRIREIHSIVKDVLDELALSPKASAETGSRIASVFKLFF